LIALAGSLGTLARYGLSGLVQRVCGSDFPWGTLVVNMAGCLVIGVLWTLTEDRWPLSGQSRAVLFIGFMGAFTTFSSFALESAELLRAGQWLWGLGNIAGQTVLGVVLFFIGAMAARLL
jgi:CrcB protein